MSDDLILPDSRLLQRPDLGCFMADWPVCGGGTVRIEVQPIYCANCGKPYGYIPKENTVFAMWLCRPCSETYGEIAGTYSLPDDEFNRRLAEEMDARYGRALTELEILREIENGTLGSALEKLALESPYAAADHRPQKV